MPLSGCAWNGGAEFERLAEHGVALCLHYKLALRNLSEMFALRGRVFSYEPVREWEAKLTPALTEDLRRRHVKAGRSWYVDETYL